AALSSLPVDRAGSTGVASLAPAARGCEFPLLEFLSQALLSAIFLPSRLRCGSFSGVPQEALPEFLGIRMITPFSYLEPTVPSA
ncbi:MAG: hypothetical protein ACK56F_26530, partial [bacterium]